MECLQSIHSQNEKVAYQVNPGEVLILDHAHDHCPGCKNCGVSRH